MYHIVNRDYICYNLIALHENTQQATTPCCLLGTDTPHFHVSLPSWPPVVETHSRDLDVPILSQHLREIERLVRETHVSAEQALTSLITTHIEEKRAQFRQEEPEYYLTITISGEPTYSKELLEHLKL